MGVDTAPRAPYPTSASGSPTDNQNAHQHVPTEEELTSLFDEAMKRVPQSSDPEKTMSKDEQSKFLKAMGDPEFRSLLNDYMLEISDPANRAETETYLAQLERDQKVPDDKLLIKPTPGFVVKTKWGHAAQKMFVNICSSEKLQPPSSTKVEGAGPGARAGTSWSLPYSVGPERTEADKSGGRVVTYDVCFHPRTLQFATMQKPYRDMVVKTCLDAIEPLVRKSQSQPDAVVSRDYHVLKGVLYKSGEPVTMCLTTRSDGGAAATNKPTSSPPKPTKTKTVERLEPKESRDVQAPPATIRHGSSASTKPLIEEVTATAVAKPVAALSKPLPKLEFRVVYRGKFEMLDHMQATLNSHETPVELPNRPRELAVEISFPNHSSAKGIDLDVNDRAVKVEAAGYQPLEVKLPFAVVEEKGSAKFDKKARKLVVTLPVQPPEITPVKRMAIVEQEEDEEDDTAVAAHAHDVTEAKTSRSEPAPHKTHEAKDDAFAMLRETAQMVANDPMYLPRASVAAESEPVASTTPDGEKSVSLEEKVKQLVADDATYADLPPLESCSEDDDDIEMDLQDMLAMEASHEQTKPPATVLNFKTPASQQQTIDARIVRKNPPFTTKETASCLSYLIEVAGVDSSSVHLEYPSKTQLEIHFSTSQERYKLSVDDVAVEIDASRSEIHAASENLVVILYKTSVPANASVSTTPTIEELAQLPAPPPVVRFQNDLLYDID